MISLYKIQKKTKWSEENHETIESGNLKADAEKSFFFLYWKNFSKTKSKTISYIHTKKTQKDVRLLI